MAGGFVQGEKLYPRNAGNIVVGKVPFECSEEVVDLGELGGVLPVAVLTVGDGAELENPGSAPVAIGKSNTNWNFRDDRFAATIGINREGISSLEILISEQHRDRKLLELENELFELVLAHGIPLGNDMNIIIEEPEPPRRRLDRTDGCRFFALQCTLACLRLLA